MASTYPMWWKKVDATVVSLFLAKFWTPWFSQEVVALSNSLRSELSMNLGSSGSEIQVKRL